MTGVHTAKRIAPGAVDAEIAARAMRRIRDYLAHHPDEEVISVGRDVGGDDGLIVPRAAVDLLAFVLAEAANGRGVTIVPSDAELTTQQAADMLNVSRPYLVGLLEAGDIPFRLVGTHRRIRFDDLRDYQRRLEESGRAAADDLSDLGQDLGI
ncbi:helix-turn-helix domain-containing protein [Nocardia cyriacigeorgica]|uniref:helix-turn-helix domain-containing protein n=1 Tax=Nocardia cyriacigeorgica TaxID=135487 RepID=UPI001894AD92|nr:helix-turn-helix domain-containing protein [Nocardia cyriacigeorgica]MBF6423399.1 helix-turn-helix domain-containing protein [Nocardia cyriacigeorgica]